MKSKTTMPNVVQCAAAGLALRDLAVLPGHLQVARGVCSCRKGAGCATPGKHPRIRWADRPAEPPTLEEIERWWRDWPDSLIDVILGERFCCLDVDEHADDHGLDELHDLERTFGPLPDTWRALTPSGGLHAFFALDGEVRATTHKLRTGVQLRAGRNIMVLPPSAGREWELSPDEVPLAPLPAWIPQYVREAEGERGSAYLPLPDRLGRGWRHDTYAAAARSMARNRFPGEAIVAALEVTDRLLGDPPKNDRGELEEIAAWAIHVQALDSDSPL